MLVLAGVKLECVSPFNMKTMDFCILPFLKKVTWNHPIIQLEYNIQLNLDSRQLISSNSDGLKVLEC